MERARGEGSLERVEGEVSLERARGEVSLKWEFAALAGAGFCTTAAISPLGPLCVNPVYLAFTCQPPIWSMLDRYWPAV